MGLWDERNVQQLCMGYWRWQVYVNYLLLL